jgi:hypothetical protein
MQKRLQIGASLRLDRRLSFRELCADTGGLDNERTMSDAAGGRTGDEVAIWSSQRPSGFERLRRVPGRSGTRGGRRAIPGPHRRRPLRSARAQSSSDAGTQYALTDAWDSSAAGVGASRPLTTRNAHLHADRSEPSFRPDADVDRVREDGSPVPAGALAEHAVEDLAQPRLLLLSEIEIRDHRARDRVAVQHPVPHLLP